MNTKLFIRNYVNFIQKLIKDSNVYKELSMEKIYFFINTNWLEIIIDGQSFFIKICGIFQKDFISDKYIIDKGIFKKIYNSCEFHNKQIL